MGANIDVAGLGVVGQAAADLEEVGLVKKGLDQLKKSGMLLFIIQKDYHYTQHANGEE